MCFFSKDEMILLDSELQTLSQWEEIDGIPPALIADAKCFAISKNCAGEHGLFLKLFGLTRSEIKALSFFVAATNSGLSEYSGTVLRCWRSLSFWVGLTSVKQSRSLKYYLKWARIAFLPSIVSGLPFCIFSAFYKYSVLVMGSPCSF